MKYTVHDVFVIELETEQIVKECINHHEAKKMSNFLNSGAVRLNRQSLTSSTSPVTPT